MLAAFSFLEQETAPNRPPVIRHSLPPPKKSRSQRGSCPFPSKSHFSFSYEYRHHMKQTIRCVIRKVQASQNVPKENQMVKTTIKKQYNTKQTEGTADMYSLHLQRTLGSTFSVTQNQRCVHFLMGWGRGHRWSWCQPVWGETFILRREKCTVSHPQGLGPRTGLPAVLLKMTASDPKSYREDLSLQLGQTSQLQALGLGAEADGHSQARDICRCEVRGEAGLHSLEASASKSSNSQLGAFCLTSDQSSITFFCF